MKILFTLESSAGMEVKMKQIKGGVTAAKGFKAASTAAGIKYKDRTDMAMIRIAVNIMRPIFFLFLLLRTLSLTPVFLFFPANFFTR